MTKTLIALSLCLLVLSGCQLPAGLEGSPDARTYRIAAASGSISIRVPPDWHATEVRLELLEAIVFINQEPNELRAFEDPLLAMPADFAGGALVVAPLPPGSDPDAMFSWMAEGIGELGDQDLEGMLVAADQVGLINLAGVESTELQRAGPDSLGDRPAVVLEGTLHFLENRPPALRTQVWLAWTERDFVSYYQMAAEESWPAVRPLFDQARSTLTIP